MKPRDISIKSKLEKSVLVIGEIAGKGKVQETLTVWISTEDIIIDIIRSHKDFSDTINQHDIAAEFMERRNEKMTPRRVRRIIEELIKEGYPIISTPHHPNGGYCWGGGPGEAMECYKRLRRKGIKILVRARRILRNSKRGQLKIF
ncbi:MAG: hypothetical protein KAI62_01045 [Actinomycetia bacterium]|nr:hypothetical protein [Actinomycetes bacterium]